MYSGCADNGDQPLIVQLVDDCLARFSVFTAITCTNTLPGYTDKSNKIPTRVVLGWSSVSSRGDRVLRSGSSRRLELQSAQESVDLDEGEINASVLSLPWL